MEVVDPKYKFSTSLYFGLLAILRQARWYWNILLQFSSSMLDREILRSILDREILRKGFSRRSNVVSNSSSYSQIFGSIRNLHQTVHESQHKSEYQFWIRPQICCCIVLNSMLRSKGDIKLYHWQMDNGHFVLQRAL